MTDSSLHDLYCTCCHVRRATRRLTRLYDGKLENSGLTLMQFGILAAIARNSGASRQAIADLLDMDFSTLSRALSALADRGLVATSPGSGRAGALSLTQSGQACFEAAVPLWQEAQRDVHHALGPSRTRELHDLLALLPGD